MNRVVVTGIGVVSPLGNSGAELLDNASAGRSGIRRLDAPFATRLVAPIAATVRFDGDDHFEPPKLRMLDRVSQFALVAAQQAVADAHCEFTGFTDTERQRAGVFVGTGMGGSQTSDDGYHTLYAEQSDRIKPFSVLMAMNNAAASWIGMDHGLTGPNLTYSTACSSSAVAVGEAWLRIRVGDIDVAIAGGAEAPLSFGTLKAWEALRTLAMIDPEDASTSCKPFSKNRSGMVLGEGAAMVVLEERDRAVARGADIYAELIGYGLVTDATHITRPSVAGQAAAMRAALRSSGLASSAVDNINAHGTGTLANDAVENAAIKEVFGEHAGRIAISATKAMHGHLLGAAGALEFALALLSMRARVFLPTMHLREADPQCDLDYVANEARHGVDVDTIMSNSFAFGGTNAVLIARAAVRSAQGAFELK